MQSRRDQVQAYRFVTRRIVSALLSGEPETNDLPMRRMGMSIFGSVMVAVIVFAAAGVIGLVTRQSAPLAPNTLVIERETRARYVYIDDRLHPVLNYASARLILGDADPVERSMSRSALVEIPRGPTLGIPGAPDGLPAPDTLAGLPWRICSEPPGLDRPRPTATAIVGERIDGGIPLGDRALHVEDSVVDYLLWSDQRLRLGNDDARLVLGLLSARPVTVAPALVNALTAGPDLAPAPVPGEDEPSEFPFPGGPALVGQLFRIGEQRFVLTRDGLVPVGAVTVALRGGDDAARTLTAEQASGVLAPADRRLEPPGFPQAVPARYPAGGAPTICALYQGGGTGPLATAVEVFELLPEQLAVGSDAVAVPQTPEDAVATVDRVLTGGGRGALVRALPAAEVATGTGTTYLLTPDGLRHPLAAGAAGPLGYGEVAPLEVPEALLSMVPVGATLDPQRARTPASP